MTETQTCFWLRSRKRAQHTVCIANSLILDLFQFIRCAGASAEYKLVYYKRVAMGWRVCSLPLNQPYTILNGQLLHYLATYF